MDTYPADPIPSYTTTMGYDNRNIKDFDTYDGKVIRVLFGPLRKRYDLVYENLTKDKKDVLLSFYEEHKSEEFYFQDIETGETKVAFFLTAPTIAYKGYNLYSVRVSLSVYTQAGG